MKICDIHTHILPYVDDGAKDIQTAVEMLSNAIASDVELAVLTPHCNRPMMEGNFWSKKIEDSYTRLCETSSHLPIKIVLGSELFVTDDVRDVLKNNKVLTLNNSRYLLAEFPNFCDRKFFVDKLNDIKEMGYIPLVAHPERYEEVISQPGIVEEWLEMGCHIQLTGGSVVGRYGEKIQKTAQTLLKKDFVCCVASDAHGTVRRNNNLLDVYSFLSLYYSKQYAKVLLYDNPLAICKNATL